MDTIDFFNAKDKDLENLVVKYVRNLYTYFADADWQKMHQIAQESFISFAPIHGSPKRRVNPLETSENASTKSLESLLTELSKLADNQELDAAGKNHSNLLVLSKLDVIEFVKPNLIYFVEI